MKIRNSQLLKRYIHTPYLLYPSLQLLILFVAILIWLINRGNAYQHFYTFDEFITAENTVISQEVATHDGLSTGGSFMKTQPLSLQKGSYLILVDYTVDREGSYVSATTSQLSSLDFHAPNIQLSTTNGTASVTIDLSRSVTDFTLEAFFSGSGHVGITNISVLETSNLYKKNLFYAMLLCLFIDIVWLFQRADATGKKVIIALSGIFLTLCYPMYTDYLTVGHDIPFHLLRIEGIAEGLRNGSTFPIKIHPFWAKGYGYAVGVLYGDALLYFPAALRLLGFSIQSAYKFFVASINLGTIVIAYFSFKRMFHSRKLGILGCVIYSASLYRLMDTYTRAAVGEYCAMMFLPLILCGFYLILTETDKKSWFRNAVLTSLGLTGLIQSHTLSCVMVVIIVLVSCVILLRRVFQRHAFCALATALGLTLLLNVGFLVPFLDYYNGDLYINSEKWAGNAVGTFQESGLFPVQLFSLFQRSNGGAWRTFAGVADEISPGVGIFFLLGIMLFGYLLLCHYKECSTIRNFKPALFCLGMGCLLLFMSTCIFPWDALVSLGGAVAKVISSLQFPWRFLAIATVLLTFAICFAVSVLPQIVKREVFVSSLMGMLVLFAVNIGWYFYDFSFNNEPYRIYDTSEINTMTMYSYEYLPAAVDPALIAENAVKTQNVHTIDGYQKKGIRIICHVVIADTEGYIDFPLNYYKYYTCTDTVTGQQLPVSGGYNGMLRVTFPADFDSTIRITFTEPWFWRLAEIVSLLTMPVCGGVVLAVKYARKKDQKQSKLKIA